ncbi:MAG: hypothetical protein K6A33_00900, partial [Clostridiales bacterium]|nr:hypothetical protein [Clostridiales bacterium]
MKKLLALVLAVVTVLGLSAASFAATPAAAYTEEDLLKYLVGYHTSTYSLQDILPLIGGTGTSGAAGTYGTYGSYGVDLSNTILTSWIDTCPKEGCDGVAYFFVENGSVKWVCTKCKATGTISVPKPEPEHSHAAVVCGTCGKSDMLTFLETGLKEGKKYDIYYCSRCKKLLYTNPAIADDTPVSKTISCNTPGCKKEAVFEKYYVYDGRLIARYVCANGHTSDIYVGSGSGSSVWGYYTVTVVASAGGTYEISGGQYGKFGDKKIVTFTPKSGYTLTSVTVDGEAVVPKNNEITFYVNGDTVIRATFTRIADLKDYTITVKKTGDGSVNIAKNSENLSSSAKVTAKNIDTVVLSFIPSASAKIVDVKVDGKSVGAVKSYTFKDLTADHAVEVTFSGNAVSSTYADVEDKYAAAVEYVTTAKIMGAYKTEGGKAYFCGRTGITVGDLVRALAE